MLRLLNRELASRLVDGEVEDAARRRLKSTAMEFQAHHLVNGRTHVVEVLEKDDNRSIGDTFQLILNLVSFFDKCRARQWDAAWRELDALNLLPKEDGEIAMKVDFVHGKLDGSLKQNYHQVVLFGMESLFELHGHLKDCVGQTRAQIQQGGGAGGGDAEVLQNHISTMESNLEDIRNRARLLVTYAGLLQNLMRGDSSARIARMEAHML